MSKVQIFGILNITPDSFSDGGEFFAIEKALERADELIEEGAHFIDVGGESTRPGAREVSHEEEWERVGEILEALVEKYPGQISLDSRHWRTADRFLGMGGTILNDVSGFQDPQMVAVAAKFQATCVVNHFPGKTPEAVHQKSIDSLEQVRDELLKRKTSMMEMGIKPENIILDPGIGFGKTMELNERLLRFAEIVPGERVLIGHSRKRFLGEHRFEEGPNLQAAKEAIEGGAEFLRVHDPEIYQALIKG